NRPRRSQSLSSSPRPPAVRGVINLSARFAQTRRKAGGNTAGFGGKRRNQGADASADRAALSCASFAYPAPGCCTSNSSVGAARGTGRSGWRPLWSIVVPSGRNQRLIVRWISPPSDNGKSCCTDPFPKVTVPTRFARSCTCSEPATISDADALLASTSTASGIDGAGGFPFTLWRSIEPLRPCSSNVSPDATKSLITSSAAEMKPPGFARRSRITPFAPGSPDLSCVTKSCDVDAPKLYIRRYRTWSADRPFTSFPATFTIWSPPCRPAVAAGDPGTVPVIVG